MHRYSRKYKKGGRQPNRYRNDAPGNVQPDEYAERENLDRVNNIAEAVVRRREHENDRVDPRTVGISPEQRLEYDRLVEEGNRFAAQARRREQRLERQRRDGRQELFTRIDEENDSGDDDSDSDDDIEPYDEEELERRIASLNNNNGNVPQQGGRKRRKTTRKRKSAKKRKTTRKKGGRKRKRKTTKNRTGGAVSDDEIINPLWEQQKVEDPTFTKEDVNKLIDEANKKFPLLMKDESFTNLTSEDMENTKKLITDLTAVKKALETGTLNLNDEDKGRLTGALGMLRDWYSWRIDPVVRWRRGGRKRKTSKKRKITRKRKSGKKRTTSRKH